MRFSASHFFHSVSPLSLCRTKYRVLKLVLCSPSKLSSSLCTSFFPIFRRSHQNLTSSRTRHLIFHRRPSASGIASVWVELLILSIFCVGYIGSAGATAANLGIGYYCHLFAVDYYTDYFYNVDDGECAIMDGLDAIAWLTAVRSFFLSGTSTLSFPAKSSLQIVLLALIILVVVSSVQQQNRGNEDVWTTQFGYATTQTSPKVTQVIPVPEVYQPGGPQVYHPVPLKSSPPSKEGQVPYPHGHGVYPHAIAGTDNYGPNNV